MGLTAQVHQVAFSSQKSDHWKTILQHLEASDANVNVFTGYAMGLPSTGLTAPFVHENAEPLHGAFITTVVEQTADTCSAIVFTTSVQEGDAMYHTAILAAKGAVKAVYEKIHLFDAFSYRESVVFAPGTELATADLNEFTVGLAVCFDLRFPELFRIMARQGVNVFIAPSAWYPESHKILQWRALALTRAHENDAYLHAADQARPAFIGHSIATSPLGHIMKEAGATSTSFTVHLDLATIEQSKQVLPMNSL